MTYFLNKRLPEIVKTTSKLFNHNNGEVPKHNPRKKKTIVLIVY